MAVLACRVQTCERSEVGRWASWEYMRISGQSVGPWMSRTHWQVFEVAVAGVCGKPWHRGHHLVRSWEWCLLSGGCRVPYPLQACNQERFCSGMEVTGKWEGQEPTSSTNGGVMRNSQER